MMNQTIYPYGPNGSLPSSVGIINDLTTGGADKALSAQQGVVVRQIIGDDFFYKTIDLTDLQEQNCSLGSTKWYLANGQRHIACPISPGDKYLIHLKTVNGDTASLPGFYTFVTNQYHPPYNSGSAIPFADSLAERSIIQVGETALVTAPEDAQFLILTVVDGGGYRAVWEIKQQISTSDSITTKISSIEYQTHGRKRLNTDSLTKNPYSLGTSDFGWYMSSSNKQCHYAIPVTPGDRFDLNAVIDTGTALYGFLTSEYTVPSANRQSIPYLPGTNRQEVPSGETFSITIPTGVAFLVLSVIIGDDVVTHWTIYKYTDSVIARDVADLKANEHTKSPIRIAGWNLGHFALGTNYDTLITPEEYAVSVTRWRTALNKIAPDILLACEYNTNFVNAAGDEEAITARDAVFNDNMWQYSYIGTKPSASSYMQTAMFSNKRIENITQVRYQNTVQAGRYYQVGDLSLFGKNVKVVVSHLDFNQGSSGEAYRAEQIQTLITAFEDYQYVILYADFNIMSSSEYDVFLDANWKMLNHGYLGDLLTYPSDAPSSPIDNILVKGFTLKNISVYPDSEKLLSDHLCIYTDLTMID